MTVDQPREVALKILHDISGRGAYTNISLNRHLEEAALRELDRAFITELVYGTVKWKLTLDWVIEQFSSIRMQKISPWILEILRLGIFQLLHMDRVPPSAACNESVKLAKKYGHGASSGFVNGVLRNIVRNRDQIKWPDPEDNPVKYLSVLHSYPMWMVARWLERYGFEFTAGLLQAGNQVPDFSVRVNRLRTNRDQLIRDLAEQGTEALPGRYLPEALILKNPSAITQLEPFRKGLIQVQDESSMLVARVLDPKPGEKVLDVCAAPGGKATHLAELMENRGMVVARDIHPHKVRLMQQAAERLRLDCIKTEEADASVFDPLHEAAADRVLVDAPCTGLGIIRKKPDIKWARTLEECSEITGLQQKILDTCSRYVKPGGYLVYSTCTLEPEENLERIQAFLKRREEFRAVDISSQLPEALKTDTADKGYVQLYPNIHGVDGFFIAKMQRLKEE